MPPGKTNRRGGRLFREALDAHPAASLLCSRAGTLLHVNPAAEELFGVSAPRVTLRPVRLLAHVGVALAALCARAVEGRARVEGPLQLPPPRGSAKATAAPMLSPSGVRGVVLTVTPSEDRLDLEALAAGLAHEIKNPLAGIKGAADLLREELPEGSPTREYPALISREATRVDALLRSLLDLTKPIELRRARQNVHPLLDDVLLLSRGSAPKNVTFVRRYDPSLPDVELDREALVQVLLNLVKNAVEAVAAKGGTVTLESGVVPGKRVRVSGQSRPLVRLAVLDDGPGLPEGVPLFTPFSTTKPKGTGLGLLVSRRLVEAHGGRLELADRRDGPGAVAEVWLPL